MAKYMLQISYTSESWKAMTAKPVNRAETVGPAIEKMGGKLEGLWLAFGKHDLFALVDWPDNASAAGFSIAVAAGGGVKSMLTTPLMTPEEGMEAMRKAGSSAYKAPGS
ncbi:MAG: GYD domain-containing protein [Dehalococcoidia bacterium]